MEGDQKKKKKRKKKKIGLEGGSVLLGNTVLKVPQHHDCEIQSGETYIGSIFIRLVNKNPLLCSIVS